MSALVKLATVVSDVIKGADKRLTSVAVVVEVEGIVDEVEGTVVEVVGIVVEVEGIVDEFWLFDAIIDKFAACNCAIDWIELDSLKRFKAWRDSSSSAVLILKWTP